MNYGRAITLMDDEGRLVGGGMQDVNTRGGVFGPGGFGGGIFDQSLGGLGATWGNTASDPEVVKWQTDINTALKEVGYNPIPVDGRLGAETCGAYQLFLNDAAIRDRVSDATYEKISSYNVGPCNGYTLPTKASGAGPGPGPGTSQAGMGGDMNTILMVGGIAALGLGAFLLAKKKR